MSYICASLQCRFEFETNLDASAGIVAREHLASLLDTHKLIREFFLLPAERDRHGHVFIHAYLLLSAPDFEQLRVDRLIASFHKLAGSSHEMNLRGGPLTISRLHRALVLS